MASTYCDPGVAGGRAFGAGACLYYPPGPERRTGSPAGPGCCPVLV